MVTFTQALGLSYITDRNSHANWRWIHSFTAVIFYESSPDLQLRNGVALGVMRHGIVKFVKT